MSRSGLLRRDPVRPPQLLVLDQLAAMGEPKVAPRPDGPESYRFLWLRTFHRPIAVRIERERDQVVLHAKHLSGAGGYAPGKVELDRTVRRRR